MQLALRTVHPEVSDIVSFRFAAEKGFTWEAGQFLHYTLPHDHPDKEGTERYFTISSAPSEGHIQITTRITGSSFKRALGALRPGDKITADGLDGDFIWQASDKPVVMVAGGIGVTPYKAILQDRLDRGLPVAATLLYFNRNDDIAFRKEFEACEASHPEFKLRLVVGEKLTAQRMRELATKLNDCLVYLSGPEPMVDALGTDLTEGGLPADQLKQDWFPGYDENSF